MTKNQPLVQAFINIHTALRTDLKKLEATVYRKGQLSNQDVQGLKNWFDYYWEHLEMHHTGEDTYFYPKIASFDPNLMPQLDALTEEHHQMDDLAARIKAAFARLPQLPAGAERNSQVRQFAELISALNTTLVNHLVIEEQILFASIQAHISLEEQTAIDKEFVKKNSLKTLAGLVPWLLDNMQPEMAAEMKRNGPLLLKFMYYTFWLKQYNKRLASFGV